MMVVIIIIIIIIIIMKITIEMILKRNIHMLTDVVIAGDKNIIKEEAEEILKYAGLAIEIQRVWDVKAKVTTVMTGAAGSYSKSFIQYLSNIPGKHESD